jgi:hypothetical protein
MQPEPERQYKLPLEVRNYKAQTQAKWRAKKKLSTSLTAKCITSKGES